MMMPWLASPPASSPPTRALAVASVSRPTTSTIASPPWTPGSSPPPSTASRRLTYGKTEYMDYVECFGRHNHRHQHLHSASRPPSVLLPSANATSWIARSRHCASPN
uniref:Uncharacterized protein n=1 Tax=Arundo donax TaxID=35708 RepID=A0A0A8YXI0_ARUDO